MPSASLALFRLKMIKPTAFNKSNVSAHTPAIKPMINLFPKNGHIIRMKHILLSYVPWSWWVSASMKISSGSNLRTGELVEIVTISCPETSLFFRPPATILLPQSYLKTRSYSCSYIRPHSVFTDYQKNHINHIKSILVDMLECNQHHWNKL